MVEEISVSRGDVQNLRLQNESESIEYRGGRILLLPDVFPFFMLKS